MVPAHHTGCQFQYPRSSVTASSACDPVPASQLGEAAGNGPSACGPATRILAQSGANLAAMVFQGMNHQAEDLSGLLCLYNYVGLKKNWMTKYYKA